LGLALAWHWWGVGGWVFPTAAAAKDFLFWGGRAEWDVELGSLCIVLEGLGVHRVGRASTGEVCTP